MPNWSTVPPPTEKEHALPLRRVPPGKALLAIVTNEDLIGCSTHYWNGRTTPCESPNCKPCNEGQPARWHSYIGCTDEATRQPFILELTTLSTLPLINYRSAHGTLRGCFFRAARTSSTRNARINLQCKPADLTKIALPPGPDLIACLCIIWNIPRTAAAMPPIGAGRFGLDIDQDKAAQVREASLPEGVKSIAEILAGNGRTK